MSKKTICLMVLLTLGLTGMLTAGELININFQLGGAEVPDGYLPDTGLEFGDRDNGYSYGWSQNMSDQTRDRNNAASQDQRYDTLIHFRGRGAVWEIELPPGFYRVFIVCGDPSNADSNNAIELEGELLAEDPDGMDSFDEFEFMVTVSDGRLTWSEPAGTYVKPCFIEIESSQPIVKANKPDPKDGSMIVDTWVNLSWRPGEFAVSHDVYLGDNFDAVSEGAEGTFIGNQADTFTVAGFPGFPFPDGLAPGMTYYWRIDEVNDTEPNSPWKGDVWSFSIPPKTAYFPDPADTAEAINLDSKLNWTGGFGAKLHTVYFGDNFDDVSNAAGGFPQGAATYTPGPLEMAKTYYWRVDEFDAITTHKGDVWSFITEGAVGSPSPSKGAVDITQTPVLTWVPGIFADSHEVYFGTDAASLELKGSGNLGSESYEPGQLEWNTTYYWRVDEANNANADSPWTGPLWSFTTANFLIIDDMESYNDLDEGDPESNRLYLAWIDGFDNPATNGSVVGNLNPPFAEQTIVHSGNQSMPMAYDNAVGKSEATLTLTSNRDWTVNGVNTLTIWYRGSSGNAAEQMYVVLNGSAVVTNDNPDAAQIVSWTEWNIDLTRFADQGVNLANVNTITLGLGNRNNPVAGGAGMMYYDDIRLSAP
ncbi:MAG: hypothetical protein ISS76_15900 [Phycisphaerae bacterium]|nr:hypothetical protein [Phycisphaerae bacterium]